MNKLTPIVMDKSLIPIERKFINRLTTYDQIINFNIIQSRYNCAYVIYPKYSSLINGIYINPMKDTTKKPNKIMNEITKKLRINWSV